MTEEETEEKDKARVGCLTAASGLAFTRRSVRRCLEKSNVCDVSSTIAQGSRASKLWELGLAGHSHPALSTVCAATASPRLCAIRYSLALTTACYARSLCAIIKLSRHGLALDASRASSHDIACPTPLRERTSRAAGSKPRRSRSRNLLHNSS